MRPGFNYPTYNDKRIDIVQDGAEICCTNKRIYDVYISDMDCQFHIATYPDGGDGVSYFAYKKDDQEAEKRIKDRLEFGRQQLNEIDTVNVHKSLIDTGLIEKYIMMYPKPIFKDDGTVDVVGVTREKTIRLREIEEMYTIMLKTIEMEREKEKEEEKEHE